MNSSQYKHTAINLLSVNGFMRSDEFDRQFQAVFGEATVDSDFVRSLFTAINGDLKKFSMEIRSVFLANSNQERVIYHGIVNLEEDFASTEHGADFDPTSLKFFTTIISKLVENDYISTSELIGLGPDKIRVDEARALIANFESLGWLRRDSNNYLILGVRAHLELRSYIENLITVSNNLEDVEEGDRPAKEEALKSAIEDLPQLLMY